MQQCIPTKSQVKGLRLLSNFRRPHFQIRSVATSFVLLYNLYYEFKMQKILHAFFTMYLKYTHNFHQPETGSGVVPLRHLRHVPPRRCGDPG